MASSLYQWKLGSPIPPLEPHSLAKHRILKRYIKRYIEIVTKTSQQEVLRMTFVDGYAGGGRYRLGRDAMPGSPLLFLETVAVAEAKLAAERSKGFKILADFIFVDSNKHHTDFLRAEIENSPFKSELGKSIHIWTRDFNDCVGDAIAAARQRSPRKGRAIFLLDQFGWSQVSFRSIRTILQELEKAEVFLTFLVDHLIDYLSEKSYDMRAFGEIDVDKVQIKEMLGIKEADQVGYRAVVQHYLYQHVQATTGAAYYSPFFIKSLESSKSYWFLHLSKHREARNEIGKIHWAENNTTVHHGGAGLHALGYTPGKGIDQFTLDYVFDDAARKNSENVLYEQLPRLIYDTVSRGLVPSVEEIFGTHSSNTPLVRAQINDVAAALRDHGVVVITDENGKIRSRGTAFDWTDRITKPAQMTFLMPLGLSGKKDEK
jgi:three-Cys-motif partner protein